MAKRGLAPHRNHFPFWIVHDKDHWCAQPDKLQSAIAAINNETQIKSKMGVGYSLLNKALMGEPLNRWEVQLVEWGLLP